MKLPKTKTGLFLVIRYQLEHGTSEGGVPIGIFVTLEAAEDYAGACAQEFADKNIHTFDFYVSYTTFYNE